MINLQNINPQALRHKKVILRLDLNMPLKNGAFTDISRLERSVETINYLLAEQAKVIIISHLGRPKGKVVPERSLKAAALELEKILGKQVLFVGNCIGEEILQIVSQAQEQVILLENLRFHSAEEQNDSQFAAQLAKLGEVYVNDAFSCSHRLHASIDAITKFLPSAAGIALEREIDMLTHLLNKPAKKLVALVGGAKMDSKIKLMLSLLNKADSLILGGGIANTFLHNQGHWLGESLLDLDQGLETAEILQTAASLGKKILLPHDFVVQEKSGHIEFKKINDILPGDKIVDIGPKSAALFAEELSTADSIVWNGTFGIAEELSYLEGSLSLANLIADLTQQKNVQSVIGGGETAAFFKAVGLKDKATYISSGGGAFLEFLQNGTLIGIEALRAQHANQR